MKNKYNILDLGKSDYKEAWELQKRLQSQRILGEIDDQLLLVEHFPVYTLGKNAPTEDLLNNKSNDISIVQSDRGGKVTFHGPGQLVGYPILDLNNYRKSITWYMRELEQLIINILKDYGIEAERKKSLTGVWVDDKKIGYGNEKAINQLLAHHGIVFKPEEKKVWLSANPYQMGAFISYDLDHVFTEFEKGNVSGSVMNAKEVIPASDFLQTRNYKNYEAYRKLREQFIQDLEDENPIDTKDAEALKHLNPYFWQAYYLSGQYYYREGNYKQAIIDFKQALVREVTTLPDKEHLEKLLKKSYRKL